MLLDTDSASLSPRPASPPRCWSEPPRTPCPPEVGRLVTHACVNVSRHADGATTLGDDRVETHCVRTKRQLWRWGEKRGGHYATSLWQITEALAPDMGWGKAPPRGHPDRETWMRKHDHNVRAWLKHLQRGGLITFVAEPDNRGQDWRTLITLHKPPELPEDELQAAERRHKAYKRRRRIARRTRGPGPRRHRDLDLVRRASARPQKATRRRLAIARACAIRDHRAAKTAALAAAGEAACLSPPTSEDRAHHFMAVPSAQHSPGSEIVNSSAGACSDRTGVTRARDGAVNSVVAASKPAPQTASLRERPPSGDVEVQSYAERVECAGQRVAAAQAAQRSRTRLIAEQAARRAAELAESAADRGWPAWRVQEAFVVWRRGAVFAGEGHAGEAGPLAPGDLELLARTAQAYEANVLACPVGWPAGGYAALGHLAELVRGHGPDARPQILHHAIRELALLAEQMHAIATEHDSDRHAKQVARARRRRQPPSAMPDALGFRVTAASAWPHWAALDEHGAPIIHDEQLVVVDVLGAPTRDEDRYRNVLRDAYLVAGLAPPPHADGRSARADRGTYDLDSGRRRAQPPPYHAPGHGRDQADPADIELARLTAIPLRAAQRLDVDERDRRLHNARAAHADQARDERDDFWQRIRSATAHRPDDSPGE